ncbi:WXG100 family type VII secretion target [Actinoplanes sp. NPDC051343]|uniref:WXG100 family type VII secretion target n=1 Tax=Actinoplanes sp. NPDC051343 TaxID=3363906 RepID=UPI003794C563
MATPDQIKHTDTAVSTLLNALGVGLQEVANARSGVNTTTSDMAGTWQGSASSAFQTNIAEWESGADKVTSALDDLYAGVSNAGKTMNHSETAARSMVHSAGGGWATNG